jgi:molybdopterin/thiamine biosynthesis adenylyltransferase
MGVTQLEVWDADVVDTVNMSTQFFRFSDIGKNKAKALHDLVLDFTGISIKYHESLFENGTGCHSYFNNEDAIMISAVDSMEVRAQIFKEIVDNEMSHLVKYIIDPRMSAETYSQFACNTTDMKSLSTYAKTLYSDANAVAERCTAKSTIYTVNSSVGLICKTVKNIVMKERYPKSIHWDIKLSQPDTMTMFGAETGY